MLSRFDTVVTHIDNKLASNRRIETDRGAAAHAGRYTLQGIERVHVLHWHFGWR